MNNMCNLDLSSDFWNNRYLNDCAGWDMGEVSPPIKSYIDQLEDRDISILILFSKYGKVTPPALPLVVPPQVHPACKWEDRGKSISDTANHGGPKVGL